MTEEKKSGSGCLKAAGVGCLVIVVLGVIAGAYVAKNGKQMFRSGTAKAMEVVAGAMLDELKIPVDEKNAAMVPIRELGQKIREGKVSADQAQKIGTLLGDGPLPVYLTLRAFELSYLAPSSLSADEKKEGSMTVSRFMQGLVNGQIDKAKGEEVRAIVVEKKTGPDGKPVTELKKTISGDELKRCLTIMKDAADQAKIEAKEFRIDLAAEVRRAIEQGLAQTPAAPEAGGK